MSDNITLGPIGQIAFSTDRLDEQVSFYRDTLGVPFLFQVPGMAFFDLGGVRLMFSDIQEGERHPASTLYFRVSDIDLAFDQLKQNGVPFEDTPHKIADMPDHELWMVFFRDPEHNLMGLMAEKPLPQPAAPGATPSSAA
jgi:methylmalonyl-CoA/ethylmalonyl-CoA epimerase